MDKYDYVTATIEEEKSRLEDIIHYLNETNDENDELASYSMRYNDILRYLNAKERYLDIKKTVDEIRDKLEGLLRQKEEYTVDNILLEDTLLTKFHEDTNGKYRNILYEDIKYQDDSVRDILYLLLEKESNYPELVAKRSKLKDILDRDNFPRTYSTLISQDILIQKQESILDEIFILENNIKVEEEKLTAIENMVMTENILKILYEFWIVSSYDPSKVDRSKLFSDNLLLSHIKSEDESSEELFNEEDEEDNVISNLNLPGVNEETTVDIDGKNYVEK